MRLKNRIHPYIAHKKHTSELKTQRVRGCKEVSHASESRKKSGAVILISHKADFNMKAITRERKAISIY